MVLAILVAGVETGVEPTLGANEPVPSGWKTVGVAVVWVFAAELALKMFVFADKPREFSRRGGRRNAFDLAVVVAAFVPSRIEPIAVALRLLRLLRILKLIRAVPQLQVIVTSLLRGTASIFYVALLMALVFYVYGIAGVHLYRENDPFHFSSLGVAFITLFRISMMDDWKVVVHVNAAGCSTDFYGNATAATSTPTSRARLVCAKNRRRSARSRSCTSGRSSASARSCWSPCSWGSSSPACRTPPRT